MRRRRARGLPRPRARMRRRRVGSAGDGSDRMESRSKIRGRRPSLTRALPPPRCKILRPARRVHSPRTLRTTTRGRTRFLRLSSRGSRPTRGISIRVLATRKPRRPSRSGDDDDPLPPAREPGQMSVSAPARTKPRPPVQAPEVEPEPEPEPASSEANPLPTTLEPAREGDVSSAETNPFPAAELEPEKGPNSSAPTDLASATARG